MKLGRGWCEVVEPWHRSQNFAGGEIPLLSPIHIED